MFRSVKSQIIAATSVIILLLLGVTATLVIDQKRKEINHDIFSRAVSFAELTHERVVTNYERNYREQAFANFNRELADIYALNEDITAIGIFNYAGEPLYQAEDRVLEKLSDQDLERIQHVIPSVNLKNSDRVVYLDKTSGALRTTDFNGRDVEAVGATDQITDIIYPFRDSNNALRAYSVRYYVSYDALLARIRATTINILIIAIIGLVTAIFIGASVASRITKPIGSLSEGARKIGSGDLGARVQISSESEIGLLAGTFNKMADDLQKYTAELVEKEKLTRELELAGEIQRELLPKDLPKIKGLDIAASLDSAEEVGGDVYDFLVKDKDNLLMYVADVTGHGVPAGLVSAINNALVPALMPYFKDPRDLVIHLNEILKLKTRPNVFITLVMAMYEVATSELHFTQAGHDPILHFQAKTNAVQELAHGGMALGMIADISAVVKTEKQKLEVGDVIVIYTDGIPEAWTSDKENLGMDRFKAIIQKHATKSTAQEIHDAIMKDVRDFMGTYPQADDITLLVLKTKKA